MEGMSRGSRVRLLQETLLKLMQFRIQEDFGIFIFAKNVTSINRGK